MKYLKLILAVLMLLCLLHMPYGYYVLVRFVSAVCFAVFAYGYYEKQKMSLSVTFGALALLFQPFIKIALGRTLWNVVDIIVAIGLIAIVFIDKDNGKLKTI